jgi:hypothetical protein
MKMKTSLIMVASLLGCHICFSQAAAPIKEDFVPSVLNQPGQEYPQVNSQGYARFKIVAPAADSVKVEEVAPGW